MKKHIVLGLLLLNVSWVTATTIQLPPQVVQTQKIASVAWQPTHPSTGKTISKQSITIKPDVAGRVTRITFHSGEWVKQGTPLLQMNDQALQAQKKRLRSDLNLSQTDLKRKQDLFAKGALSKAELDQVIAQVESNQANIEQISAQIEQHHIKAPFSGKLGLRQISQGDYLSPGQTIVNLESMTPLFVDFDVPETLLKQINIGQKITVASSASPNTVVTGSIQALESKITPGTQSLRVRGQIPNSQQQFLPGTFVNVTLYLGAPKNVIMIPQTSVLYSIDGNYVYTVDGTTAHKKRIHIAFRTENAVIVQSGLKEGDTIVTVGNLKLYDGAQITTAPNITSAIG